MEATLDPLSERALHLLPEPDCLWKRESYSSNRLHDALSSARGRSRGQGTCLVHALEPDQGKGYVYRYSYEKEKSVWAYHFASLCSAWVGQ